MLLAKFIDPLIPLVVGIILVAFPKLFINPNSLRNQNYFNEKRPYFFKLGILLIAWSLIWILYLLLSPANPI